MHANRDSRHWAGTLAVVALLLAACGGGDATTASEGTTTSTGAADATATTTAGNGETPADGSAVATTTTGPAQVSSGGGAAPTTTAPVNDVADDTPGLPGAGQYRYHTTGTSKVGANPSQPVNEDTITTVVHLGDGKVRQSGNGQETVLQFADAQVLLHTMDFNSPGFERHFEAKPPVQYAPRPLQVGQTWAWKLTATNLPTTVQQDSRVDRLETITVAGKTVKAIVVVTKLTLSGDVTGTIDLTQWVDTATDVPARIHAKTNIVTYAFTSDTTSDFTGFGPR